MAELVICDTNVVIQLAIISPDVFANSNSSLKLAVHHIVKNEVSSLQKNPAKKARLGDIFDFIMKDIRTTSGLRNESEQEQIRWHRKIKIIEESLDPKRMSAGSSHLDRMFLMLAHFNAAKLVTNERTLYELSCDLLGEERALDIVDILEAMKKESIATQAEIQEGLNKLSGHGEQLAIRHKRKLNALGYSV